jgi:hypothetical protein
VTGCFQLIAPTYGRVNANDLPCQIGWQIFIDGSWPILLKGRLFEESGGLKKYFSLLFLL